MSAADEPRRKRMTPDERRTHLLDSAADLLVQQGFDALTMEAVAQQAGVSKSLGWAYFTNLDDLVQALFARELSVLYDRIESAIEAADGFEEKVRAAVRGYFDVVDERGAVLSTVQAAVQATSRGEQPRDERTEQLLVALGGLIRLRYRAAWPVAFAHAGVIASLVSSWGQVYGYGAMNRQEAEDQCVAWVLAGLEATLPVKG